jgi:hypothetical protein
MPQDLSLLSVSALSLSLSVSPHESSLSMSLSAAHSGHHSASACQELGLRRCAAPLLLSALSSGCLDIPCEFLTIFLLQFIGCVSMFLLKEACLLTHFCMPPYSFLSRKWPNSACNQKQSCSSLLSITPAYFFWINFSIENNITTAYLYKFSKFLGTLLFQLYF